MEPALKFTLVGVLINRRFHRIFDNPNNLQINTYV